MSEAKRLLGEMFDERVRALNRLVVAAEALKAPALPDVPPWANSPKNAETIDTDDPEELRKLAVEWQAWAVKLDDILAGLDLEDLEKEIAALCSKAEAAREALIAIDLYDPPVPGSP